MAELISGSLIQIRRSWMIFRKRISLSKFEFKNSIQRAFKKQDIEDFCEEEMSAQRSINLLNFEANHIKDQFLLDIYSDKTQFGGSTETNL